ncbi:MAG: nucleotidyltransferase domain-containing protein, partial [Nitrospinota bacterium]
MRYKKEALKEINEVMPALIQNLARKEGKAHPERRIETIKKIKTALDEMRESVKRKHTEGANGSTVSRMLSENIDYLIQELFTAYSTLFFGKNTNEAGINLSVVAIGGYGRSELQPFSDIDIFFLFKESLKSAESNIVSSIVTALWDFGFEVGHVARTASECIALIKSDLPSKTALIDSRFLLGNPDLYREFKTRLTAEITKNSVQSVIGFTLDELKTRHKKYGDTVFVAEPNIKEGVGGLRDYQSALWVSAAKFSTNTIEGLHTRGIIGSEEKRAVLEAVDFLLRVRNELHFLNARREDTLLFEFQNKVAHLLGYGEEKEDIDRFVKDYFHHASTVAKFSRSTFHSCQTYKKFSPFTLLQLKKKNLGSGFERIGSLIFVKGYNPDIFKKDPVLLLDIFLLCQDKELT